MLLAISRGATVADPVFAEATTQFVWDSPLKILFLYALPAKVIAIALAFALLAVLPVAGLAFQDNRIFWLTVAAVFLTPAFKVSIQNIGVGDGLMFLMILLVFYSSNLWLLGTSFSLIALWHPQQSFFIGISFLVALYCYAEKFNQRKALVVLGSLAFAAMVFLLYKYSLNFQYSGREAYMLERVSEFLQKNLIYAPVAFAPISLWLFLIAPKPVRGGVLLALWLLILAVVSLLTTDVTRSMTLITLPIVLTGAAKLIDDSMAISERNVVLTAVLIGLIPPYSWSGLDVWLWTDLVEDFCKWGVYCG